MPLDALARGRAAGLKERILADALQRIGRFEGLAIDPIQAPTAPLGYRNRVEFSVGFEGETGRLRIGLRGRRSSRRVPIERCLLQGDAANRVLARIRAWLDGVPEEVRRALPAQAEWRLTLRHGEAHGELLVVVGESSVPFPGIESLAETLMSPPDAVSGVVRRRTLAGRRGGGRLIPVAGRATVDEKLGGQRFRLPAGSFTQVSAAASSWLVERVVELAGDIRGRSVIDLYGGVGLYGFALRRAGAGKVLVVDADADAIRCGRQAARRAGERGLRHVHADVRTALGDEPTRADLIVANPPRSGMGKSVTRALARFGCPLIVVSCDPATLARDLRQLASTGGYRPTRVIPVDLFPQTPHVETVVRVEPTA